MGKFGDRIKNLIPKKTQKIVTTSEENTEIEASALSPLDKTESDAISFEKFTTKTSDDDYEIDLTKSAGDLQEDVNFGEENYETPLVTRKASASSFNDDGEYIEATFTETTEPFIHPDTLMKIMAVVIVTSLGIDLLLYIFDVGLLSVVALIAVTAIIMFLLVAEYRKPTMIEK
jgi:hypothetical protein